MTAPAAAVESYKVTLCAAGILYKTPENQALFVKRSPLGDFPGYWCFPGGKVEEGETTVEAASREAVEEVGVAPDKAPSLLARSINEPEVAASPAATDDAAPGTVALPPPGAAETVLVDFSTFLAPVDKTFEPTVPFPNDEHVGFAWAPITSPPEPLHPGCRIALDRLFMDELGVARAMAASRLTSPQVYKNVTLWAMRITGTGVALRSAVKDKAGKVIRGEEFPWRDPAIYLNDEFLARCNGLAVVWVHPDKKVLDHKAFVETNIGSIFVPYVKGDEVWGIAKVYDDDANAALAEEDLSTSPGVVISDPNNPSYKFTMEDGATLLVEGKPSLLDHLAICERGVWDKGGEAAGIINDSISEGENDMADEKDTKDDAAEKEGKFDKFMDRMDKFMTDTAERIDAVCSRVDAFEKKGEDEKVDAEKETAEEVAADKAKKDAEDKEKADAEEKERDDAVKADALDIKKRIDAVEKALPKERNDDDMSAMTDAQARADAVFREFGQSAPRFLNGEDKVSYRRRLLRGLQEHSPAWKPVDLATVTDSVLAVAEEQIFNDASRAARDPKGVESGALRMIPGRTEAGHRMNSFVGQPSAWLSRFGGHRQYVTNINTKKGAA